MKKFLLSIIAGIGIAVLYLDCSIIKQSQEALHWPQTKGKMISSSLTINYLPKFLGHKVASTRWYGTHLEYEYSGLYDSNRLSFRGAYSRNPKEALKALNKYRRLHDVIVYYDPKDPKESVLEPGSEGDIITPFFIGGVLAFLGLFLLFSQSLRFNRKIDVYINQGRIYQSQGKLEEALLEYNQAIRVDSYLAIGYSCRGGLYLQQEQWDLAIADLNLAITIGPKNAFLYYNLAEAYFGKGEYDKAWENINKAKKKGFVVKRDVMDKIRAKFSNL